MTRGLSDGATKDPHRPRYRSVAELVLHRGRAHAFPKYRALLARPHTSAGRSALPLEAGVGFPITKIVTSVPASLTSKRKESWNHGIDPDLMAQIVLHDGQSISGYIALGAT